MKIETFTVCYNEEKMLHYFLRHYMQYGSVTIFDNYSTDNSVKIANDFGANVIQFNSDDKFREDLLINLRNICWKESKADWVIIVDVDEFVYHKRLQLALARSTGTVILPHMFDMYSDVFPTTGGQIYDEVKYGIELRSKMCIFRPSEIKEMNYEAGNHFARPEGNFVLDVSSGIINMHFKNLSLNYMIDRYEMLFMRQSQENIDNNWNWHLAKTPEKLEDEYNEAKLKLMKIL